VTFETARAALLLHLAGGAVAHPPAAGVSSAGRELHVLLVDPCGDTSTGDPRVARRTLLPQVGATAPQTGVLAGSGSSKPAVPPRPGERCRAGASANPDPGSAGAPPRSEVRARHRSLFPPPQRGWSGEEESKARKWGQRLRKWSNKWGAPCPAQTLLGPTLCWSRSGTTAPRQPLETDPSAAGRGTLG